MVKKNLCGLSLDEIISLSENPEFTLSHALSLANSVYKKRMSEISQIQNIPIRIKKELDENISMKPFPPISSETSLDNTVKYLFKTSGAKVYEAVYIPDGKRNTVCVSTQAGCRMGCRYCITARIGYRGNLTAGEMINQILSIPEASRINHVVLMGMGEPMDNLNNVLKACEILTASWGLALGSHNITVSSVGITPAVKKFLKNSDCNFTLSFHSPFSEDRKELVPIENRYPAGEIIRIMKNLNVKRGRRLTLAYIMVEGLNDSDLHLMELIKLLGGTKIRVNLLPLHEIHGDPQKASSDERIQLFKHSLITAGISASIRKSRGSDISAACGMLAAGLT
jgi:23S rRNA (adenine2503-C2)-methyltransferase